MYSIWPLYFWNWVKLELSLSWWKIDPNNHYSWEFLQLKDGLLSTRSRWNSLISCWLTLIASKHATVLVWKIKRGWRCDLAILFNGEKKQWFPCWKLKSCKAHQLFFAFYFMNSKVCSNNFTSKTSYNILVYIKPINKWNNKTEII